MRLGPVDADVLGGSELIFLISQPRAGSTLLQRILGCHPDVHTAPEPWLMLHLLYALKPDGVITAEYDAFWAREAVQRFVAGLPGGEETYHRAVRRMAVSLYGAALSGTGKRYFLDKTPRYYLIVDELARLFPRARFILLLRNPLAVFASMLDVWVDPRSGLPASSTRNDLSRAPRLLVDAVASLGPRAVVVHYEGLVQEPDVQVPRVCRRLGLDVVPGMVEYGRHRLPHWELGDTETVYKESRPVADYAERWLHRIREPQCWRLTSDYLTFLGRGTMARLGYDYDELRRMLDAERPARYRLAQTYPLHWWLDPRPAKLACASLLVRFQAAVMKPAPDGFVRWNRFVKRLKRRVKRVAARWQARSAPPKPAEDHAEPSSGNMSTGRE